MSSHGRRGNKGRRVVFRICRGFCLFLTVEVPPAVRTDGGALVASGKEVC